MLYQIRNGTVSAGGRQILSHIDFEIKGNEHIGIVGRNGAGKTTLLKLIAGELFLDRDDRREGPGIRTSRAVKIGMLRQTQEQDLQRTVEELLLESCPAEDRYSQERYAYELSYDRMFTGMGFGREDKERLLGSFSGGEQTRIALIRLFLSEPDLLLLDEPTNHLDLAATEWLEEFIRNYKGAVLYVSHDRFFLDRTATVIYELKNGQLKRYPGNYTHYRQQKQKELQEARKAYDAQQKEVERLTGLIEKFKHKPRKAAFARSRKTILERMEKLPKPEENDIHIFTGDIMPLVQPAKWILQARELKIGYAKMLLMLSLRVKSGQKIGIIGDNGAGKTTFLKTVAGLLPPLGGECVLGERTMLGYFDQLSAELSSEKSVLDHFHDLFPALTDKEARQILGAYLFGGAAASVTVNALSGGEKARLLLCELLQSRPNLLLLDEPTNHMDIQAKETLESAFRAYKGTILFVSHDRYFVQQVADSILVLDGASAMYYPFGYEHYLARREKGSGEQLSALIRAEDQALLAGIRAVPEKERHRLREIGTEEAFRDWQLRLAAGEMEEAAGTVRELEEQRIAQYQKEYESWAAGRPGAEETDPAMPLKKAGEALERWTKACISWYEIHEGF
ncbi:MAG: ABC-F family ATP-binding cassette domain-containing protein [Blautia sp.]|nr:ABC-F family ATP-binding cassette domain-containing protein [Blautia sp.]